MRETTQPGQKQLRPVATQIRSVNDAERTIEFVASTEVPDRYGDIIRVVGWQLENYQKNPVFLWAHRSGDPPIGKTVAIGIEENPPALVQKVQFAPKEIYPFADTIYRLYKGGYLNATSVGFMPDPEKTRAREDEDGNMIEGLEFNGQELLELSAVPVPANPEALGRMVQKGIISENEKGELSSVLFRCGEDNPPWAYMAPGVTFPEDPEAPAAASMAALATDLEGADADRDISCPRKLNARKQMEVFCDEGRRLIADAQSQLAAIRLTLDQARLMTREGLWQISEELVVIAGRLTEIEKRSMAVLTVDADAVRAAVREEVAKHQTEIANAGASAPVKEIPTGDGGAPEKPASETPDPETKSDAPGELAPGVEAILQLLVKQPGQ